MQRRWCHFLAACPIPSPRWTKADSTFWSQLEKGPAVPSLRLRFPHAAAPDAINPRDEKFDPPASRDKLGSRSCGHLTDPILRMKRQKRELGMEKLSGK